MAFKDIQEIFYNGSVKITYHDKAHKYYRSDRVSTDLAAENPLAWSKGTLVKGVTTIMDNVLEKKGLMTWPMGLALRELFGYYDFKNETGEHLVGFSKGVGSIWLHRNGQDGGEVIAELNKEEALNLVQSASKAWQRKKKQGADIGSLVHDAIEQYILGTPFELTLEKYKESQDIETMDEANDWFERAPEELKMAQLAFNQFKSWWVTKQPKLIAAEKLVYSKEFDYCGTFDAILEIDGKRVLVDWKTSNASSSKDAAAPQGVYYSYFVQSGAYAQALNEMHAITQLDAKTGRKVEKVVDPTQKIDDLLIVSARKDGGFDTVYASDVGLSVEDCIGWWKAVWLCNGMATRAKAGLLNNVKEKENV